MRAHETRIQHLRRTLLCAAVSACFSSPLALANPTGPAVAAGSASFATAGKTLTVTNTPSAIINWQGFSIGAGEATRFQQQSAASAVMNRVVGQDPSVILGTYFGALYCNDDCANVPAPAGGPPANGLHLDVADGRIIVATRAGVLEIAVGQFGYVQSGDSVPVQVPESRGIRVTLPPQAVNPAIRGGTVGTGNHLECTIR